MADDLDELARDVIRYVSSSEFSDLPEAERIARGNALLRRIEDATGGDSATVGTHRDKRACKWPSPELPELIGEVVIAAAWAEDAAGTLLQASKQDWDKRADGFDATSTRLLKALKPVVSTQLHERLDEALQLRHFVVHGIFVDGSSVLRPSTGQPYDFISMKRSWATAAPERQMKAFTADALRWLAQEFWEIEDELESLHGKALFGDGEAGTVPGR